jgi:hypothetical protein
MTTGQQACQGNQRKAEEIEREREKEKIYIYIYRERERERERERPRVIETGASHKGLAPCSQELPAAAAHRWQEEQP